MAGKFSDEFAIIALNIFLACVMPQKEQKLLIAWLYDIDSNIALVVHLFSEENKCNVFNYFS